MLRTMNKHSPDFLWRGRIKLTSVTAPWTIVAILPGRSLVGLFVAGSLALYPAMGYAQTQGPGSAQGGPLSSAPGLTPQQVSVAQGLEKTCSALDSAYNGGAQLTPKQQDLMTTCNAIIADYERSTDVPSLQQTLNAVSGRQATATARVPMQFAAGQISNIGARLDALRSGERGFSFSGLDFGLPGGSQSASAPLMALTRDILGGGAGDEPGSLLGDRLGVFVTGTLRHGTETTTDSEEGFSLKDTGVTVGVDYRLGDSYVLGLALGYGKSETVFDDSGGNLNARHSSVSVYGSYSRDQFHIDWLAGFGHHNYDLSRDINFASSSTGTGCGNGSCSIGANGSTTAREYSFSTGGGLDFHREALAFGPTLEFEYKQVAVNSFNESGPSGLDLDIGGLTSSSLLAKTGGYASYALNTRWFVVVPQVRARLLHEFLNSARAEQVQFAADTLPGASDRAFYVFTDRPDRTYFDWRASLLFQFRYGLAGFIDYGGLSGLRNISTSELNIGLRLQMGLR